MHKQQTEVIPLPDTKSPLGETPAKLAKRDLVKPTQWCPKPNIDFDAWCDPDNPKTVTIKDVCKAATFISPEIPKTPLTIILQVNMRLMSDSSAPQNQLYFFKAPPTNVKRSKCCLKFGMELYYKYEIFHRTGSFHERGAFYSLSMLTDEQRRGGVYTASIGNWAMALAYQGQKLKIPITVVLPVTTRQDIVEKCQYDFGASVFLHGNNLSESKKQAFTMIADTGSGTYINGYDHPNVIAASGSIGLEILDQLPSIDAIILPIGGGGLIAGVATAIKQVKPGVLIYGVEPDNCCSFFKALENERPYQTEVTQSLTGSLAVPTAGFNAFHTARSLIDKMILVDDDWVSRSILHLVEEEKFMAEGAGAASLGVLLAVPDILPELRNKNVVCVITGGGNIDYLTLSWSLERAKAIEGRIIKVIITMKSEDTKGRLSILSVIANVGCSIRQSYTDRAWIYEDDLETVYVTLIIETRNLEHACTLKRVLERIFPGVCEFLEEPFSPIPICACFPKRL